MIALEISGHPVAFARAGTRGGQRFTPAKQREYANLIKLVASQRMVGQDLFEGPLRIDVRAVYMKPESWSRRRKSTARWKQTKPDVDNLAKIAADAMSGIVYRDDNQIVWMSAQKMYGERECMTITVARLIEEQVP